MQCRRVGENLEVPVERALEAPPKTVALKLWGTENLLDSPIPGDPLTVVHFTQAAWVGLVLG